MVCRDNHQSLWDEYSKEIYLKWMFHENKVPHEARQIVLEGTYRCPPKVAAVANAMLLIKYELIGGKLDSSELSKIISVTGRDTSTGHVLFFTPSQLEQQDWFIADHASDFAVVTLAECVQEAKILFNTPLVFSVDDIKGLQFPKVVAYKLLSAKDFVLACSTLSDVAASKAPEHRAKEGKGDRTAGPCCNKVYTALTRAMNLMVIVEEDAYATRKIISRFKGAAGEIAGEAVDICRSQEGTIAWLDEAIKLRALGHQGVADDIYQKRLNSAEKETYRMTDWQSDSRLAAPLSVKKETPAVSEKSPVMSVEVMSSLAATSSKALSPEEELSANFNEANLMVYINSCAHSMPPRLPDRSSKKSLTKKPAVKQEVTHFLFNLVTSSDANALVFIRCFEKQKQPAVKEQMISKFFDPQQKGGKLAATQVTAATQEQWVKILLHYDINLLKHQLLNSWVQILLGTSPGLLHWLTGSSKGLSVFTQLITLEEKLWKQINPAFWCDFSSNAVHRTPFYKLTASTSKEGMRILLLLSQKQPQFFKSIPREVLSLALTEQAGEEENMTPLYWLTYDSRGWQILRLLLAIQPDFLRSTATAWGRPLTKKVGHENITPLKLLTGFSDNLDILSQLLRLQPTVFKAIPAAAWGLALPEGTGDTNNSPLFSLTYICGGLDLLEQMMEAASKVIINIPAEAWVRVVERHNNTTPLHLLVESPRGQQFLWELVQKAPALVLSFSEEAWQRKSPCSMGNCMHSPLSLLDRSREPAAVKLLAFLREHSIELAASEVGIAEGLLQSVVGFFRRSPAAPKEGGAHRLKGPFDKGAS